MVMIRDAAPRTKASTSTGDNTTGIVTCQYRTAKNATVARVRRITTFMSAPIVRYTTSLQFLHEGGHAVPVLTCLCQDGALSFLPFQLLIPEFSVKAAFDGLSDQGCKYIRIERVKFP